MTMSCTRWAVFAVMLAAHVVPVKAQAPVDVRQFLKQNGLEQYHDCCVQYVTALAERKPEAAAQILTESFPPAAPERDRDAWRSVTVQIAPHFVKGAQNVELVGYHRLSNRVIALCYMAHSNLGPMAMLFMAYQAEAKWYSRFLSFETNGGKMVEMLKGATRFTGDTVSPLKGLKGRTAMR